MQTKSSSAIKNSFNKNELQSDENNKDKLI